MWSSPAIVTAPAAEPLTLAAVKEFVRIDADIDSFDTELSALIAGVREDVERLASIRLVNQTVKLAAASFADLLHLPIGPVRSVDAITYTALDGTEATVDAAAYVLFGADLEQGVRPATGVTWPKPANLPDAIEIQLQVGYGADGTAVPPAVRVAMLRAIRARFDDRPFDLEPALANHRIWLA
ncbi:hypothetical protein [Novosphingobium sp. EMRT-2]|uniref:head-tail connector protein n=1 Tax=Novosphingobium sp. EMRT-2 TaxID=2571749 RepID=UPI0010BD8069|nr:hypothetical protein [Novosphingobium sp. EMRT-2]QCI92310.1 hypothetical protein FA702_01155 [Novosphingobium sp. EMRT-2]